MANENGNSSGNPIRKKIILGVVIVVVVLGVIWGFGKWQYSRAHESTDNAQIDGHITPVLAKVGGYVATVRVDENQPVTKGDTLVTIDDAEYRVRYEAAQADLATAQAAVGGSGVTGQAQAQVQGAADQRRALNAQIDAARANYTRAQADFERFKGLAAQQIISRQQLDAARAAVEAARAAVAAAEGQAAAAGATVTNAQAGVRAASAKLDAARAARDNAQLQLDYTTITAPESGIVARKQVEVGQLVQPGQPLMNIVSDTAVWITANFKETQLADIRVGQPVTFDIDAYGGCQGTGKVESVSGATGAKFALLPPDNATGNFTKVVQRVPVRIAVTHGCNDNRPLRPGLSVNVHVLTR